jgi:hypothetical protein
MLMTCITPDGAFPTEPTAPAAGARHAATFRDCATLPDAAGAPVGGRRDGDPRGPTRGRLRREWLV